MSLFFLFLLFFTSNCGTSLTLSFCFIITQSSLWSISIFIWMILIGYLFFILIYILLLLFVFILFKFWSHIHCVVICIFTWVLLNLLIKRIILLIFYFLNIPTFSHSLLLCFLLLLITLLIRLLRNYLIIFIIIAIIFFHIKSPRQYLVKLCCFLKYL